MGNLDYQNLNSPFYDLQILSCSGLFDLYGLEKQTVSPKFWMQVDYDMVKKL